MTQESEVSAETVLQLRVTADGVSVDGLDLDVSGRPAEEWRAMGLATVAQLASDLDRPVRVVAVDEQGSVELEVGPDGQVHPYEQETPSRRSARRAAGSSAAVARFRRTHPQPNRSPEVIPVESPGGPPDPEPRSEPLGEPAGGERRRRVALVGGGIACVLLAAGGVWLWPAGADERSPAPSEETRASASVTVPSTPPPSTPPPTSSPPADPEPVVELTVRSRSGAPGVLRLRVETDQPAAVLVLVRGPGGDRVYRDLIVARPGKVARIRVRGLAAGSYRWRVVPYDRSVVEVADTGTASPIGAARQGRTRVKSEKPPEVEQPPTTSPPADPGPGPGNGEDDSGDGNNNDPSGPSGPVDGGIA